MFRRDKLGVVLFKWRLSLEGEVFSFVVLVVFFKIGVRVYFWVIIVLSVLIELLMLLIDCLLYIFIGSFILYIVVIYIIFFCLFW